LLNSKEGVKLLASFNDEQLTIIEPALDVVYWKQKFNMKKADLELVKEIIKEANVS